MIISDDKENVEFKSISPYFEKERDGLKCNTERIFLTQHEEDKFVNAIFGLLTITITNSDTKECFVRVITDISYAELEGIRLYIISWMHKISE